MPKILELDGIPQAIKRILQTTTGVRRKVNTGLKKCGLLLQRESMKIVPVDTGNLRGSAYCRAMGTGSNFTVVVGYITYYAIYVHEMTHLRHKPGKQAKFLEEPARRLIPDMQNMIVAEVTK